MEITIYRRHSADCPQKADRYAPRCGCSLSGQFNWPESTTKFEGRKLKHGQNKWSLNACTWSEAQQNATKLKKVLEALLEGKPVQKAITVETAVQEWLTFRLMNGLTNTKPKFMAHKLVEWCKTDDVLLLSATTPDQAIKFRISLPFRTVTAATCRFTGRSSAASSIGPSAWGTFPRTRFLTPVRTRSSPFATRSRRSCPRPRSRLKRFLRPLPGG